MENLENELGIEFISYGLAPNPNGYCYEIACEDTFKAGSNVLKKRLKEACELAPKGFLA